MAKSLKQRMVRDTNFVFPRLDLEYTTFIEVCYSKTEIVIFWLNSGWFCANFCKNDSILNSENGKRYEFLFSTFKHKIYNFCWGLLPPVQRIIFWPISDWFLLIFCKIGSILNRENGKRYEFRFCTFGTRIYLWRSLAHSSKICHTITKSIFRSGRNRPQ